MSAGKRPATKRASLNVPRRPSPERWDALVLDALRALDQVDAAASAEAEFARTRDELRRWTALDLAREALRAVWGPRGEDDRKRIEAETLGDDAAQRASEERTARRWAMIEAAHEALAGAGIVQGTNLVRVFAKVLVERPSEEAYLVDGVLRLLAMDLVDAGDIRALRTSPERVHEIGDWLRHCKDGPAKRGKAWTSPPHAILARIVEASHGRPTDSKSIKAVVIDYAKALKRWSERR